MFIDRNKVKDIFGVDYYDGSQIHSRFAYKAFRDKTLPYGNIICFVSPTEVTTNLIDLEDAITKDYIYSNEMINFCFELPTTNLWGGVAFQRLFASVVGNILAKYIEKQVEVDGDDIFVIDEFKVKGIIMNKGKASVSIVTEKNGAILGHLGLNVNVGQDSKAPAFAYSTNLTGQKLQDFINECIQAFYQMVTSIFIATTKTI